jgi:ABC-type phosphate transport system substrate-binding protein
MKARLKGVALGVVAMATLTVSERAFAQDGGTDATDDGSTSPDAPVTTTPPSCSDTNMFPNPIYITGSTAFEPVIQAMAFSLKTRATPVTLLFVGTGSCVGVAAIQGNSNLTGQAHYYASATDTSAAGRLNCNVDTATPPKADVAISDVFYSTCGVGAKPAAVGDFNGPAQAMLMVVPQLPSPSQAPVAITAEEAADVWGCGARGMVSPWTVQSAIQQRSSTSGTQNIIARSINVLASTFNGTQNTGTGNVINTLINMDNDAAHSPKITIADPTTAIGFIAADAYDTARSKVRSLAFRGIEQNAAYYADSTSVSFDKANVRNGHYLPWGYEHVIVRVDSTGKATTDAAQNFLDWVLANPTTTANAPNFDPVSLQAAAHVIPLCAMKVQRAADGGDLSPYTPADSCNCLFEAVNNAGTPPASCVVCDGTHPCATGACHHGYCE